MYLRPLLSAETRKFTRCVCCACGSSERTLHECVQAMRAPWVACLPCSVTPPERVTTPCRHVQKRRLRIMPDFGGAYLWRLGNDASSEIDNPIPNAPGMAALEDELRSWQAWFERECDSGDDARFPWSSFHSWGRALAKRLARLVAPEGIEVYYERPYEDPEGRESDPERVWPWPRVATRSRKSISPF